MPTSALISESFSLASLSSASFSLVPLNYASFSLISALQHLVTRKLTKLDRSSTTYPLCS